MAIYVVSLPQLAEMHARRTRHEVARPGAAGTPSTRAPKAAAENATKGPADVPAPASTPLGGKDPGAAGSVEGMLSLPKSQIEALLADRDESGSRALLSLICRLSSVEAQLADLRARVCGMAPSTPPPATAHAGHEEVGDASKADLLEQVFRNNLLLRRMD